MATRAVHIASRMDEAGKRPESWRSLQSAAFASAWDNLASHAIEPNAFAESWFMRPALEQFDPLGRIRFFCLWDGPELCGLMPLSTETNYGRWPVPHIQNWLHHNAFLGTPLIRYGYAEAFWRALLAQLDAYPGRALFAHFNGLPATGPVVAALEHVCVDQNRRLALVNRTERALLEHGLSPDAYFDAAVRPKKRKELRRQKNRLMEEGALTFTRDHSATGLTEWTAEFLALERRGWKGDNGSALASAPATRVLFTEVLSGAAASQRLERLDLRLDGKPLAMLVNFLCPPGSFSFKTAFDENYARFSPGVLLQIENLGLLDRDGIAWCDSCAAEGHPMIDSLWTGRRTIGRFSVAIGGSGRRSIFGALLSAELARESVSRATPPPVRAGEYR